MGSGETAPTMVKAHRQVFDRLGLAAPRAVLLDTPYGFQANADIISDRAVEYFRRRSVAAVEVAQLPRTDTGDTVAIEQALARIRSADWLFTGPGSPSFALRQWAGTPVPDLLAEKIRSGGALVFSSAAALTLGRGDRPGVRDLQGRDADPVLARRPRPALRHRPARRRHPPLRQHRGRQPRHPLLLPRPPPARATGAGAARRRVRARRGRAHRPRSSTWTPTWPPSSGGAR